MNSIMQNWKPGSQEPLQQSLGASPLVMSQTIAGSTCLSTTPHAGVVPRGFLALRQFHL